MARVQTQMARAADGALLATTLLTATLATTLLTTTLATTLLTTTLATTLLTTTLATTLLTATLLTTTLLTATLATTLLTTTLLTTTLLTTTLLTTALLAAALATTLLTTALLAAALLTLAGAGLTLAAALLVRRRERADLDAGTIWHAYRNPTGPDIDARAARPIGWRRAGIGRRRPAVGRGRNPGRCRCAASIRRANIPRRFGRAGWGLPAIRLGDHRWRGRRNRCRGHSGARDDSGARDNHSGLRLRRAGVADDSQTQRGGDGADGGYHGPSHHEILADRPPLRGRANQVRREFGMVGEIPVVGCRIPERT
jgi:hypothetical protein